MEKIEYFGDNNRYTQPDLSVITVWPMLKNYRKFKTYEEDYQKAIIIQDNRLIWIESEKNKIALSA